MSSTYKRKTDNPNLSWSEERRAAWALHMKERHKNGTWHKISEKDLSKAISKGLKKSRKKKNLSEARKKAWVTRKANGSNPVEKISKPVGNETPGQRLLDAIRGSGMTQRKFASKIDMSPNGLNQIVKDKKRLSKRMALATELITGVRAEWILNKKQPVFVDPTILISSENEKKMQKLRDLFNLVQPDSFNVVNDFVNTAIEMQYNQVLKSLNN